MFTDPVILIDETLDRLETLSVLFADEVDERVRRASTSEPSARLCRDVQSQIELLIPKLKAAKATQQPQLQPWSACINCD